MRRRLAFPSLFCCLLLLSTSCSAAASTTDKKPFSLADRHGPGDEVPDTYIVELHPQGDGGADQGQGQGHHGLLSGLLGALSKAVSFTPLLHFNNPDLFLGVSLKLDNAHDIDALRGFHGTKAVHPVRRVKLSKPNAVTTAMPPSSVAQKGNDATSPPESSSPCSAPHDMMGICSLHAEGNFGAGILIGVLDTGVDYTHSALNGGQPMGTKCFGDGCPVQGGWAFVDDDGDRVDPKPDPFSNCPGDGGHGTHVTGVILGNDTASGFLGVAPQARANVYRVFGCSDSTTTDILMAAMSKAFEDGVDLISMSIAGLSGWPGPEDVVAGLASRIVERGVPVVAAMGNEGEMGLFYASHPASAIGATGVASVQNTVLNGWSAVVAGGAAAGGGGPQTISYVTANAFKVNGSSTSLQVYTAGKGNPCASFGDKGPDLSSKLVLFERSPDCGPQTQISHATDHGARHIFFYMRDGQGLRTIDTDADPSVQVAVIPRRDALLLMQQANGAGGGGVSVDFGASAPVPVLDDVAGGFMSYFSAYGPSWEVEQAAGLTAVGGNVLSAWPVTQGKWAIASGTSTATPMVSGAYALYLSAKDKPQTPSSIRAAFASTARAVPFSRNVSTSDTVARQGAGLIDAYAAVHGLTRVWPDRLNLNDTEAANLTQTLAITNTGSETQEYAMGHVAAGTVYSLSSGGNGVWNGGPVALVDGDQATVTFSPSSFKLEPNESQTVQLVFTPPAPKQDVFPVYSGFVQATSSKAYGNVSVPYLGLAAQLSALPVLNVTTSYDGYRLPGLIDPSFGIQITSDDQTFSLEDEDHQPAFVFGQVAGTMAWAMDLVLANTTLNTTTPTRRGEGAGQHPHGHGHGHGRRAPLSHEGARFKHLTMLKRQQNNGTAPAPAPAPAATLPLDGPPIVGRLRGGDALPRDADTYSTLMISHTYTDPSTGQVGEVADGSYRVLLRVLRLRGARGEEDGWESYLSRAFKVRRAGRKGGRAVDGREVVPGP